MDTFDTDWVVTQLWGIAYMAGFREGQISKDAYGDYPAGDRRFVDLVQLICKRADVSYSEVQQVLEGSNNE